MHIRVRVTTQAKQENLIEEGKGLLRISVKEPAEDNRANRRVLELVARHFNLPSAKIRMLKGHRQSSKTLEIVRPP